MASESNASSVEDLAGALKEFTAWFYGCDLQGEKVVFQNVHRKSDVADLKKALNAELRSRVNLGSFLVFKAERMGGGDAWSWKKSGVALDVEQKLSVVFGGLRELHFFVERFVAGSWRL